MFVEFKSQWLSIVPILFYFLYWCYIDLLFFPVVSVFNCLFSNFITL